MTLAHFLMEPTVAAVGSIIELSGPEARHAVVVKRTEIGEQVALTDGAGSRYVGEVTATSKTSMAVRVLEHQSFPAPTPRLTVVQALAKGDRSERAVEMLTEVGVDVIVPWAAERSVAVWRGERGQKSLAKWRTTAQEAAKQSRRVFMPEVTELHSTAQVASLLRESDFAAVLHEEAHQSLSSASMENLSTVTLVVGPEGGIGADEVATLGAELLYRLGDTVLRTSTAGVVGAAIALAGTDRFRGHTS